MMIGGAKVGEQSNKHFIVDCFPITAKRQKPLYIIEDGIMHPLALSRSHYAQCCSWCVLCTVLYYVTDTHRRKSRQKWLHSGLFYCDKSPASTTMAQTTHTATTTPPLRMRKMKMARRRMGKRLLFLAYIANRQNAK